jgi:hypothetical protein
MAPDGVGAGDEVGVKTEVRLEKKIKI